MQILSGLAGYGYRTQFRCMVILPVTSTRSHQKPAVGFNLPQNFANFHARKNSRRNQFLLQRRDHTLKHQPPVRAAQQRFAGALGMRHQAGHIPPFIADAGDI